MNSKSDKNNKTKTVIESALKKAKGLGIKKIIVASCTGRTAEMLIGSGLEVVCVTHQIGFYKPGEDEMSPGMRKKLEQNGVKILTTTHLMAGVDRSLRLQFGGIYPSEIVATALRMFGDGIKVCIEISTMSVDAGLADPGKDLIAIGGTGQGADTAAVINPSHSQHFFKTKVREIICKPNDF